MSIGGDTDVALACTSFRSGALAGTTGETCVTGGEWGLDEVDLYSGETAQSGAFFGGNEAAGDDRTRFFRGKPLGLEFLPVPCASLPMFRLSSRSFS